MRRFPLPGNHAAAIAIFYVILGGCWISFSDHFLTILVHDSPGIRYLQTIKGWGYVLVTGAALYLLVRYYLRALGRREEALREVAQAVAGRRGSAFFDSLVEHLARTLGVDFAFVGERTGNASDQMRTIAVCADGRMAGNFEFDLAGSPFGAVMDKEPAHYPAKVSTLFPDDAMLRERGIEGNLLGFPLLGPSDEILGVLAVMNRRPYRDRQLADSLLRFFAVRVATELRRQREEESLRADFDQISAIFDSLSALVYVVDIDSHKLLYLNRFGQELFGTRWHGKTCFEWLRGGQIPCEYCTNEPLKRGGTALAPLIWEYRNPANKRWYQCIDKAIRWPDGRLVRLEIALDITERKEIDRLKDEILSAVSHEMRTPLTAVLGYAEFLLETEVPDDERKSCLRILAEQAERLNDLIGDFLQLQRLQARRSSFRFQAVPVRHILEEAARSFRTLVDHDRLKVIAPSDLPPVLAEEKGLLEIIERLVSNALKYSEYGEITLGARLQAGEVLLSVRDAGIGIPPDQLERIFDPLYRIDNSDRRESGGAGLGLALVREVVREHGGRVWAESALGQGTTFFVALPAAI